MNRKKVPIMLLFFNRPDTLKIVFDAVKQYQPNDLFLVQDGARTERPDDVIKIEQCRQIVKDIDWPCNVRVNYSKENMSCDYREYTGIGWCFEQVEELVILEDDCVPTQSFFMLCEECLEKYRYNSNIHSIVGFSRVGNYEAPYDYVFSMTSAGWGWATWKRVWDRIDELHSLSFIDSPTDVRYLNNHIDKGIKKIFGDFISYMKQTKHDNEANGIINSWERLVGFTLLADNMLTITPTKNLVKYIGVSEDATHCMADPRLLTYKTRKVLLQPAYNLEPILKHPPFIIRDTIFEKQFNSVMKYPLNIGKIERLLRRIWFGKFFHQ